MLILLWKPVGVYQLSMLPVIGNSFTVFSLLGREEAGSTPCSRLHPSYKNELSRRYWRYQRQHMSTFYFSAAVQANKICDL